MPISVEMHCHNSFSNFHLGDNEPPYDCDVSVSDQLERARAIGLDAIFVTNHNTLDGYVQMLEYRDLHEKFSGIEVYPAEEITTDTGAHVLAYGIHKAIVPGLAIEEVIDEIRRQSGISSAPHPFSLLDALREDAVRCDMMEVFNSNNLDFFSNVRAAEFAEKNGMVQVAGSDSHVLSTLGRCINMAESENSLDDILCAMGHGRISISRSGYAENGEILGHLKYKADSSREYVLEYVAEHYPNSKWLLHMMLKLYELDKNSRLWDLLFRMGLYFMRRISKKINYQGMDGGFMKDRNLATMFKMAI